MWNIDVDLFIQVHSSLKTIKKKLVRKALDAIKKMADDQIKCKAADEPASGDGKSEKPSSEECERFETFWKEFGRALKLGILEDDNNRYGSLSVCVCLLCLSLRCPGPLSTSAVA